MVGGAGGGVWQMKRGGGWWGGRRAFWWFTRNFSPTPMFSQPSRHCVMTVSNSISNSMHENTYTMMSSMKRGTCQIREVCVRKGGPC